ncbi:MAG: acyl-CoA thioesterase [Planctomycetes bacterium]|nr:acyl-CoA thioesterase [Planctomycetota bacterium]
MQAPELPADEEFRFRATLSTRWSDKDIQGVLNNAVYLTLCEEARYRYFDSLGLIETDRHFPFVLAQSHLRFIAPGNGPAMVEILLRTVALGNSSFRQVYRLREISTGQVWVECEALLVCWDPVTRGSRPMGDHFRDAVARFEGLSI